MTTDNHSTSPALGPTNLASTLKANSLAATGPTIPWRRANVRHTSNELYVDIVESISVILAPSGQPLSARSNGSISFTSKISGVPDLILVLNAPGGTSSAKSSGITRTMQLPVFHPCVRLARWKEHPGELSFIPPDGKFMLAGYEVDLLPSSLNTDKPPTQDARLFLPATIDLKSGTGSNGTDFEARLTLNNSFPGVSISKPAATNPRSNSASTAFSFGSGPSSGTSGAPVLEGVAVSIPFPSDVRNITDFKPSRGDASFNFTTKTVEWRVPTKDGFSVNGTATLTGTVVGALNTADGEDDLDESGTEPESAAEVGKLRTTAGYYDEDIINTSAETHGRTNGISSARRSKQNKTDSVKKLMPHSIAVSFTVKGWLPSGIKVDSLMIDAKKSKGLGEGVKPYKGVKYLTVSRKGVERRL
jgi:AP-3 complex subunit mu